MSEKSTAYQIRWSVYERSHLVIRESIIVVYELERSTDVRIGICPGSFDPVTNGHIDIFERASKLVDQLIVAVSTNPNKHSLFTMEERADMIRQSVKHIPNIQVDYQEGLLNAYVKSKDSHVIIRGLRALSDFEYEFQRALFAKQLDDDIETIFIMTNNKYSF